MLCSPSLAIAEVHHDLEVVVNPARNHIDVTDTITATDGDSRVLEFTLHSGLTLEMLTQGVALTVKPDAADERLPALNSAVEAAALKPRRYRVVLPAAQNRFRLRYQGVIRHDLRQDGEAYARGFSETSGMIGEQGVFLAGRSYWYPHFSDQLMTFDLSLRLPQDWFAMSQGERALRESGREHVREQWRCSLPQEEIYLIAGRFTEYTQATGGVRAMVLLRQPDPSLAQTYLDATVDYVRLFADLIGPYPFEKFALVENFWETGYGMPSFTLLGPRVIRFPFILHSSYPHEILHNWWGNSVYIDYESGNWAEGLTSYLADHLVKEQRGQAVEYRRSTLQKYTDYVRQQQDFPLTVFRSRHSAVTEAVGYGKTLMLFHMLRRELGDEKFIAGLRALYARNRFRVAGFRDVKDAFSETAGQSLDAFFAQWVERPGAPQLRIAKTNVQPREAGGFVLTAVIEQLQDASPFKLSVPLAIRLEGREQAWQTETRLDRRQVTVELELPARPLSLDVDPQFDVFRRLHRNEIPPAISQALGDERILIVLPAAASGKLMSAYEGLARSWQAGRPEVIEIAVDADLENLPNDRSVWLFGWHNRFRDQLTRALAEYAFTDQGGSVRIDDTNLSEDEHAVVVMGRRSSSPGHALGWLAAGDVVALPGLGRKLPHYGKYSYLAFTGEAPDNVLKGQWPVVDSPLSVRLVVDDAMPATPATAQLSPRPPLVAAPSEFSLARMQRDIAVLADPSLAGRGLGTPALDRVADYIATAFRQAGLQPGADGGKAWLQTWEAEVPALGNLALKNVIAVLPGSDAARAGESLVVGAHYDHLGVGELEAQAGTRGQVHPGADDNASGVAVMLELARVLAAKPHPRSIVFVAFTGEEAGRLGSQRFIQDSVRYPAENMIAMINLDTVGRLGKRPLLVLGTGTADEWVHILRGAGFVTGVQVKPVAGDIGSSDQTSFIEAGVPAVQLFSGAHADFHRPGDTLDKIDSAGLVKVAQVLKEMTVYLAGRPKSLTSSLGKEQAILATPSEQEKRRGRLGIVPDYAASGDGVAIAEVDAKSPAAAAGLRRGDVIRAVNDMQVRNLREYTRVLKGLNPGDPVEILLRRDSIDYRVTVRVVER